MKINNQLVAKTSVFFGLSILNLVAVYHSSEPQLKAFIFSQVALLLTKSLIFPLDNEVLRFQANFSKESVFFGLIFYLKSSIVLYLTIPNFEMVLVTCYFLIVLLKYNGEIMVAELISTTVPLYLMFGDLYVSFILILTIFFFAKSLRPVLCKPSAAAYLKSQKLSVQYIPRSFSSVMSGYADDLIIASFLSGYIFEGRLIKSVAGVVGKVQYVFNVNQYESMRYSMPKWCVDDFRKSIRNWHYFVAIMFFVAISILFSAENFWLDAPLPIELYMVACIAFAKFLGGWSGAIFNVREHGRVIGVYYLALSMAYAFFLILTNSLELIFSLIYLLCLQIVFNYYVFSRVR